RADSPLQALHRRFPCAARRSLCGGRTSEGRVRHLPHFGWRQQALPDEDPRARVPAPAGAGGDVARPHACRRGCHHRHPGHRIRGRRSMSAVPQPKPLLSTQAYRAIDRELAKYPPDQKQSAVISALAIAQTELGWISKDVMEEVARYLDMPAIA